MLGIQGTPARELIVYGPEKERTRYFLNVGIPSNRPCTVDEHIREVEGIPGLPDTFSHESPPQVRRQQQIFEASFGSSRYALKEPSFNRDQNIARMCKHGLDVFGQPEGPFPSQRLVFVWKQDLRRPDATSFNRPLSIGEKHSILSSELKKLTRLWEADRTQFTRDPSRPERITLVDESGTHIDPEAAFAPGTACGDYLEKRAARVNYFAANLNRCETPPPF